MKSDLKCQRCGFKQAAYHMHSDKNDIHCSNMYKCLVRRMDRMEKKVGGDWPTKEADEKRIKDWKVGGTD